MRCEIRSVGSKTDQKWEQENNILFIEIYDIIGSSYMSMMELNAKPS